MPRSIETPHAPVMVVGDAAEGCRLAAERMAQVILDANGRAVLGLATGATPIAVYAELAAQHRDGRLSFRDVTTYNLDEYYPIRPLDPNSYRSYMDRHLFSQVDLAPDRAHVLDGTVPDFAAEAHCRDFDAWIDADGGLDLQLLGIGRNGHIGFNEPSDLAAEAAAALPTRPIDLHPTTVQDAIKDFGGRIDLVPRRALTMGTATILKARSILVLAFGPAKADAVAASLQGPITGQVPASLLQYAPGRVTWIVDAAAAKGLGLGN